MTTIDKTQKIQEYAYPVLNMGTRLREMMKVLNDFEQKDIINRIWHKDYTVWKTNPTEISDRLGWLQIIDTMVDKLPELNRFASEIKDAGFHHIVLLGMGGSSLGPEVLKQTFGSQFGYPELIVLDSTNSATVQAVSKSIEARHTLFLVSSKSGSTIETMSLYRYFRNLLNKETGQSRAGDNFAAITDYGTPLALLAQDEGFRHTFINPSDLGGRYSVLSYFGLVPAVLSGIDIKRLIDSADKMQENCAPCVKIYENPGAWLGGLIASLALHGHDKLTFFVSPAIRSFGLWVEQLIAESTGKEGRGIIPIIDEPIIDPKYYGDDRLFIYLRLNGDNNSKTDETVEQIEVAGQPIIQVQINDQYDLGAEFFRWEFAVAMAAAVLGINPFDQPDVQASKEATKHLLQEFKSSGHLPKVKSSISMNKWLEQAKPGNYLAIMVYLKQTKPLERALAELRRKVLEKYHIATTLGYGPRFLHSTGQLHKGGPNTGLFLQIVANRSSDLRIPGEPYTFNVLTEAEAQGDFQALKNQGKRIVREQLCSGSGAAISRVAQELIP